MKDSEVGKGEKVDTTTTSEEATEAAAAAATEDLGTDAEDEGEAAGKEDKKSKEEKLIEITAMHLGVNKQELGEWTTGMQTGIIDLVARQRIEITKPASIDG